MTARILSQSSFRASDVHMAEDIENHTIRLLQEMRTEMRADIADIRQRVDGNTLLLNLLAGLLHEHRLVALETRSS